MDDSRPRTAYAAWEVDLTLEEALGRADRADPVCPRTGGPAGNARLTAWTGMVLLVLLAVEGVTLIDVRGLISWHIVVGTLLVPPALLKTATTGWRILRYYRGERVYRAAGPPPMPLRVLGPLVVLSTMALLATGILVALIGPQSGRAGLWGTPASPLFLHQASFAVWVTVTSLHVLGRIVPALRIVSGRATSAGVDGRWVRLALLVVVLAGAVWLAVVVLGGSADWTHQVFDHFPREG